jgi:hypothetical protein
LYEVVAASSSGTTLKYGTSALAVQYSPLLIEVFFGKEKVLMQ